MTMPDLMTRPAPDLHTFEHHWQDEADAAFLYRILATAEPDQSKRDVYQRLAEVEDRHVDIWGTLLTENGRLPKDAFLGAGSSRQKR